MGVPLGGVDGAVLGSEMGTVSVYSEGGSMPLSKERWGWNDISNIYFWYMLTQFMVNAYYFMINAILYDKCLIYDKCILYNTK